MKSKHKINFTTLYFNISLLILSGCAVGPDFVSPQGDFSNKDSPQFRQIISEDKDAPKINWLKENEEISSEWWKSFNNPVINEWVEKALKNSPNIKIARSTLAQVRAIAAQTNANNYPEIGLKAGVSRQESATNPLNSNSATNTYTLYSAGVTVNYLFDVFGGVRRANEAQSANIEAQEWETKAAMNTIAANVINLFINLSAIQEQVNTNNKILELQKEQLNKSLKQREIGVLSDAEILPLQANINNYSASLPSLIAQKQNLENQIMALCGEYPDNNKFKDVSISLENINLPKSIPLWLPSELVRRRPDIRSAEAKLHSAYANIGIAEANLYPQVGIAGNISTQAVSAANLFKLSLWSIASSITQSIFKGGETKAKIASAEAGVELAKAQYEKIVLNAFTEVSNLLISLSADSASVNLQKIALKDSQSSYLLYQQKYNFGGASTFDLINTEKVFLQSQLSLIKAKATQLTNIVALYQAAGGVIDFENYK